MAAERCDPLTAKESLKGDKVVDQHGKEVLSQRLSTGELLFYVPEVPALSSRHFRVVEGKCSLSGSCKIEERHWKTIV